jgi:hypothetical protein
MTKCTEIGAFGYKFRLCTAQVCVMDLFRETEREK